MHTDETTRCAELLRRFSTAMLMTHDGQVSLHACPMAIASVTDECEVWFFTDVRAAKVRDLQREARVQVLCQSPALFLSLKGEAHVMADATRVAALWKDHFRAWFPNGPRDPNLVLVRVTPSEMEYWNETGLNTLKYVFQAAKAYVTGTPLDAEHGEHAMHDRVRLD